MKTARTVWIAAVLLLTPPYAARAGMPGGIGVLGDSYSDEYQFYPPDRSTARNWVEILAATRGLDFGRFDDESRGEPRNRGFAYNWARSDATTFSPAAIGFTMASGGGSCATPRMWRRQVPLRASCIARWTAG